MFETLRKMVSFTSSVSALHVSLRLLLISTLCGMSTGIICKICRHTGLSLVPPSARNSLLIFDSQVDNCDEEDIMCSSSEDYCVAASAKTGEHKFWIQKGCIASGEGGAGRGCNEEMLDFSNAGRRLPVALPEGGRLTMTVCVCNDADVCNAGSVSAFLTDSASGAHPARMSWTSMLATAILLILTARANV